MLHQLATTLKRSFAATLLALLLLIILGSGLGMLQTQGLAQLMNLEALSVVESIATDNTLAKRNFLRLLAIINQLTTFLIPALVFAYLLAQRNSLGFLKLRKMPKLSNIGLGILFLLFFMPLAQYAFYLNKQLPLPDWMVTMEDSVNGLVSALLVMNSPSELLLNLLTIAVIPAIAEECLFRGVIQQKFAYFTRRPILSIWLAATIFSAFHGQFEGFLARLLLGAALGYLLHWTQNLWIPIIAHFVNNGFQVVGAYFYKEQLEQLSTENSEPISIWLALLSSIFVVGIGYFIQQNNERSNHLSAFK